MVRSVLQAVPQKTKEEWKCAIMISGVLSVMIPGVALMQESYVGSWDILHQVSYCRLIYIDVSSVVLTAYYSS